MRKRRARGSISVDEILHGAYQLASEGSLDSLSMPRLARQLDVGVTSIYWYFRSKEDLLDVMTERALAEFDQAVEVSTDLPWDEYLTTYFTTYRDVLRNNSLWCDLIVMRGSTLSAEALRVAKQRVDVMVGVLTRAGFTTEDALHAHAVLSVYSRGAIFHYRQWESPDSPAGISMQLADPINPFTVSADEAFDFGLQNSIRGLRALLAATARP
ncbi:MAG TPA: TetR/AcrR family transcriptional regulator [Kineosporiaceae bacterium]